MASLKKTVESKLRDMRDTGGTGKGEYGELAALSICEQLYQTEGGILYHSYEYPVEKELQGNIKRSPEGNVYVENLGSTTELDILYVSKYRVFPIEVKAYKAKEIIVTDTAISGCYKVDKSPLHQNEMHCRHLYPKIVRALPNGESKYIVPIVVFVDRCKLTVNTSDEIKRYIRAVTLNQFRACLSVLNTPCEYLIDLDVMDKVLNENCSACRKRFPLRKI